MFGWMFHSLPNVSLCLIPPMCVCDAQHYDGIDECFSNTGREFFVSFLCLVDCFLKCVCDVQHYDGIVECFSNTGQKFCWQFVVFGWLFLKVFLSVLTPVFVYVCVMPKTMGTLSVFLTLAKIFLSVCCVLLIVSKKYSSVFFLLCVCVCVCDAQNYCRWVFFQHRPRFLLSVCCVLLIVS